MFARVSYSQSGWIYQNSGLTDKINSIKFVNSNTGWCVGNNSKILKTTNGGNNWVLQNINFNGDFYEVYFTSADTGYITGEISLSGFVYKTTNGGTNWIASSPNSALSLRSISFIDSNTGFVGEYNQTVSKKSWIHKTTNSGSTWIQLPSESPYIKDLQFINETTGWLTGGAFVIGVQWISKTVNGGLNWTHQFQTNRTVDAIYFIDSLNGWMSAYSGFSVPSIFRSTNGGNNWVTIFPGGTGTVIYSLYFINKYKGWAAGEYRKIQSTTNGGIDWIDQTNKQGGVHYRSIYFTDSLTGWVVGDSGTILKTTSGGVLTNFSNTSTEIPDKYFLSQNYPNPFNPVTVIRYTLSATGGENRFVSLKVYDILGNEVVTLVNRTQNSGIYEVDFDGSNLSSGVYYYKIWVSTPTGESNDFIQTKKMLLLK